jgi:hypothetical protein
LKYLQTEAILALSFSVRNDMIRNIISFGNFFLI